MLTMTTTKPVGTVWVESLVFALGVHYRISQVGPEQFRVDGIMVPGVRFFDSLEEAREHLASTPDFWNVVRQAFGMPA